MRLRRGESFSVETREHENATVILGGTCDITTSDGEFKNVGRRPDVFSGMPWALYLSRRKQFEITATSDTLEFASCWAPTDQDFPTQLVTPADQRDRAARRRQRLAPDQRHPAARLQLPPHRGGRGLHALGQLVQLSAA